MWVLRPGLAPLLKDLVDRDQDLFNRKIEKDEYEEDKFGFLKKKV